VHFLGANNVNLLGRGVVDGNGAKIRNPNSQTGNTGASASGQFFNLVRIDSSKNITVDGIVARDSAFWNTLPYESDMVTIQNYKVINQRPSSTTYNQTDGVDFDSSSNGLLSNAFLYTGDDNIAVKCELSPNNMNLTNITHQHVVTYSNSAGSKIGTKTGFKGATLSGIVFKDFDIVKTGRALAIDGSDDGAISNVTYQDIRVEEVDSGGNLIDFNLDRPPNWRTADDVTTIKGITIDGLTSVSGSVNIHGKSSSVNINGVTISNMTINGQKITSQPSGWSVNSYVSGLTFQ
ncbi:MAG: glycosyl hydrolase family 28 protein, partial [Polyangiaceae bacterium]|nr:glycosyl hydrolase family 28 protein [Polyangiaceae bacterium]